MIKLDLNTKRITADIVMILIFALVVMFEYTLFVGIFYQPMILSLLMGFSAYYYIKFRSFVMSSIETIIVLKLKAYFQYQTVAQISSDLMRSKLVYFEFVNHHGVLIQGKAKLNENNLMEITRRNEGKNQIIEDPNYNRTIDSLMYLFKNNRAIVLRGEKYFEALKQNKCTDLLF